MPTAIKEAKAEIKVTKASLTREKKKLSDKEAELNERERSLDKLENIIKEKITNFFNKFLMPIFKRFEAKHQLEVLAVLDQQMIDRPTAQKLHKIGYPNMEGRPFEDALDIAEERDIFDLLKQHAPSLDAKNVTTNDYNTVIEAVREGTTLETAAKAMAEKLVEKFPPVLHRGHGR